MSFKLGVLIVHGIGNQNPAYANDFIKDLQEKIRLFDKNPDAVKMMPTTWATEVQPDEEELWRNVSHGEPLNFGKLRKFLISYVGDAVAYAGTPNKSNGMYQKIQRNIHETIEKLYIDLGKQDKPLIVISHSFGTQIISDYIWDRQKAHKENNLDILADNDFERMNTLSGFFTFGSSIPLFTIGYHPLEAIEFPPKALPEDLKSRARWYNFYDVDDVLGYPLKNLSESYQQNVTDDVEVNVGNWLQSWNPLCHFGYWKDDDCLNSIAEFIAGMI
ncbi:MAG: hypothetical protein MUC49_03745 [Raineya sp.]|jgi:hypothetical protein|nr:hypothetical protein [Raineya sp.]